MTENNVEVRGVRRLQLLARVMQLLYLLMGITNALLLIRILLAQAGANPESGFVRVVFSVTDVLLTPFAGVVTGQNAAIVTPIIAIIVYSVGTMILVAVLNAIFGGAARLVQRD